MNPYHSESISEKAIGRTTNPQVARSSRAGRAKSNQWPAIPLVVDSMSGKGGSSLEAEICIGGPDERG